MLGAGAALQKMGVMGLPTNMIILRAFRAPTHEDQEASKPLGNDCYVRNMLEQVLVYIIH